MKDWCEAVAREAAPPHGGFGRARSISGPAPTCPRGGESKPLDAEGRRALGGAGHVTSLAGPPVPVCVAGSGGWRAWGLAPSRATQRVCSRKRDRHTLACSTRESPAPRYPAAGVPRDTSSAPTHWPATHRPTCRAQACLHLRWSRSSPVHTPSVPPVCPCSPGQQPGAGTGNRQSHSWKVLVAQSFCDEGCVPSQAPGPSHHSSDSLSFPTW